MQGLPSRSHLKSLTDVLVSIVLLAAAGTVIYRNVIATGGGTPNSRIEVPSAPLLLQDGLVRGANTAKAVLVGYSDFQCPYCARFAREILPEIERKYVDTGRVAFVFRHLPLPIHGQAVEAAVIAECAARQGRFWETHDQLFAQQTLTGEVLDAIPDLASLDRDRLDSCMRNPAIGPVIQDSVTEAHDLGIRSTPAFLIGTRLPDGRVKVAQTLSGVRPIEDFIRALDSVLRATGARS